MRIGRLKFRKPWTWLPDCAVCTIPVCGTRWMQGGSYNCGKKIVWDKTHDMDKVREYQRNVSQVLKRHPRG